MNVLVDTSVLIDHLRGDPRALAALLAVTARGDIAWSVTPVRTEVLGGMRPGEERRTRLLLATIRWLEVTVDVADRAGELVRRYHKAHSGIDTVDYLIAAGVDVLRARLLTLNVKHFPMLPRLAAAY